MKHLYNIATFLLALIINSPSVFAQGNSFGYPVTPDTSSASTDPVGSPAGSFAVSPLGAATYTVPIEVPQGLPGATPQIAISYNSQGGNGVAGYGCSLSGVSTITRVPRDIYHDGAAAGIDYTADDAFSLDGRRLILTQPAANSDSAVYCLEDSPDTQIVLHSAGVPSGQWFHLVTPDGIRYEYGESLSFGRENVVIDNSVLPCVWYISKVVLPTGQWIQYHYAPDGSCAYLASIVTSNYCCRIEFTYEERPDTIKYRLPYGKGEIRKRLKTIKSSSYANGSWMTYREYSLTYNQENDGTEKKFSRLVSLSESNGNDETYPHIIFDWNYLPDLSFQTDTHNLPAIAGVPTVDRENTFYLALDANGDAVTDLILCSKKSRGSSGWEKYFSLYVSSTDTLGNTQFSGSFVGACLELESGSNGWNDTSFSPSGIDANGDGLNELLIPRYFQSYDESRRVDFNIYHISQGGPGYAGISYNLQTEEDSDFFSYSIGDVDNDGKDEIIVVEEHMDDDAYPGAILWSKAPSSPNRKYFRFVLPDKPEQISCGDFNGDGLTDLIFFYGSGYGVALNDGTWLDNPSIVRQIVPQTYTSPFITFSKVSQGDFNGDGIIDFLLHNSGATNWYVMEGTGNGTFYNPHAWSFNIDGWCSDIDTHLSCSVCDMDGDGRSDAVIMKKVNNQTHTYVLHSTGSSMTVLYHTVSNDVDDALPSQLAVGDFNGDGLPEFGNKGYKCLNTGHSSSNGFNIYRNRNFRANSGKVTQITDGLGNNTNVSYGVLSNSDIYTKNIDEQYFVSLTDIQYPVSDITIPMHVVKKTLSSDGASVAKEVAYQYGGLKLHRTGKGLLGFSSIVSNNSVLGETLTKYIAEWNSNNWTPKRTYTWKNVSNYTETKVDFIQAIKDGEKDAYYLLNNRNEMTDMDGNTTIVSRTFLPSCQYAVGSEVTAYPEGHTRMIEYQNYLRCQNRYLPQRIIRKQDYTNIGDEPSLIKHWFRSISTYQYDGLGRIILETMNDSTSSAVSTNYSYDSYGNVISTTTQDVVGVLEPVTETYQYDPTHRFVTRSVERGYIEHEYTYDLWGNILTDTDKTRPSYPLTTEYDYDGWGNVISTTSPEGMLTTRTMGWGSSLAKRYYVLEQGNARPWVKKWYDSQGREVLTESVAQGDILLQTTSTYNNKGLLTQREDKRSCTGTTQTVTEDFTYDSRGRKLSDVLSTGESTTYTYGNRSITVTAAGRTWTTRKDSWGNVIESIDPLGNITTFYYQSCGKPDSVISCGSTVTMEYDDAGRQTALHDPDAGTMRYAYDAYGRVTLQTDARNYKTASTYDGKGRLASTQTYLVNPTSNGYYTTVYTYGQSASDRGLLLSVSKNNGQTLLPPVSISYAYDALGRVSSEQHTYGVSPQKTWTFQYAYNSAGQLSSTTYPSGLQASYAYDAYGNLSTTSAAGQPLEQVQSVTPIQRVTQLGTGLTYRKDYNMRGQLTYGLMRRTSDNSAPAVMSFTYDNATANLTSRSLMVSGTEYFTYDALNRLTSVRIGDSGDEKNFAYAPNGNLIYQTGLGHYYYESAKPHAVTAVDNLDASIPTAQLTTSFNNIGKIDYIHDDSTGYRMSFNYGVDNERIQSTLSRNGTPVRTTYYLGDFEEVEENGATRYFHYLGNNVLYIKQQNGTGQPYYLFTDHLGSITCIVDQQGNAVFRASYDAWGRQTVTLNTIGFHRGYTGHEMMPEFGLINMNGRLYDPLVGRFLSTDNFVQEPWNSQNFNRYSYCLNNPLMYTDPNGELAWFVPVIIGAAVGAYTGASIQSHTAAFWNWKTDAWKGAIVGAIIGGTIGYQVTVSMNAHTGISITGLTKSIGGEKVFTEAAGITGSILQGGVVNIGLNALGGGDIDEAWKSGVVGLATSAWSITGGFGMAKGFGATSRVGKLIGKLGYQMLGTTSMSIGNNWTKGEKLLSSLILGVGPVNLTMGKGQRLLQWKNNIGNILANSAGIFNLAYGGKVSFDWDNLTFAYSGGLRDKWFPGETGFGSHAVFGNKNFYPNSDTFSHELHHLWQSRAMTNSFLPNYGLHGLTSLLAKGNFIETYNFLEQIAYFHYWY